MLINAKCLKCIFALVAEVCYNITTKVLLLHFARDEGILTKGFQTFENKSGL